MKWITKTGPELSAAELYSLLQLRIEVFTVEQDCPYQDLDGQDLDESIYHIRCFDDNDSLLAYIRVMYNGKDKTQVRIGRVVVSKKARSLGLGRELMKHALALISQNQDKLPRKTAMLHGQSHLRKFYESFNFVVEGDEFLEDGIPHFTLVSQLN